MAGHGGAGQGQAWPGVAWHGEAWQGEGKHHSRGETMSDKNGVKTHPPYREAVERILERFQESGYGTIITDEDFDRYMSIEQPEGLLTYEQYKGLEIERLQRYKAIELLLYECGMCLSRSKVVPGFEILPPSDQIKSAYDKAMRKFQGALKKAAIILLSADPLMLTAEQEAERQRKAQRIAFLIGAGRKRRFEIVGAQPKKKITSGE
jgi:hypothetical protein